MFDPNELASQDIIILIDKARSLNNDQQLDLVSRTITSLNGRREAQSVLKEIDCAVLKDCYNEALLWFSGMNKCYPDMGRIIKNAYLLALNNHYQSN